MKATVMYGAGDLPASIPTFFARAIKVMITN